MLVVVMEVTLWSIILLIYFIVYAFVPVPISHTRCIFSNMASEFLKSVMVFKNKCSYANTSHDITLFLMVVYHYL
jgi:hypothetical protein